MGKEALSRDGDAAQPRSQRGSRLRGRGHRKKVRKVVYTTVRDVALEFVAAKVSDVETSGLGRIGRDDLYVTVAGLELQFCH